MSEGGSLCALESKELIAPRRWRANVTNLAENFRVYNCRSILMRRLERLSVYSRGAKERSFRSGWTNISHTCNVPSNAELSRCESISRNHRFQHSTRDNEIQLVQDTDRTFLSLLREVVKVTMSFSTAPSSWYRGVSSAVSKERVFRQERTGCFMMNCICQKTSGSSLSGELRVNMDEIHTYSYRSTGVQS